MSVTVQTYAEELVRLVNEDRESEPGRFGACRSWTDLHDVCDANEYLIDADEKFGLEFGSDDHMQFCNEAISRAGKILFHGDGD